jgi:hypothetical protein
MKLFILDNGGETFDRYTIINEADGEVIGASEYPYHPQGFGQHCGNVADNYWIVAYGHGWRRGTSAKLVKKRTKYAIELYKADCANVGKPLKFEELPADVQKFAKYAFRDA